MGVRVQKAAATRAALIAAARRLFAEKGYHGTGTPELVAAAGVSRGALYHHFTDKEALFEAVFREVEADLSRTAGASVAGFAADPLRQLREGLQAFLRIIASNAETQRILLVDGPAVLGWRKWRELGSEVTVGYLTSNLRRMQATGVIGPRPVVPLAHLIIAALNEAALLIANSREPEITRAEVTEALWDLVAGLR